MAKVHDYDLLRKEETDLALDRRCWGSQTKMLSLIDRGGLCWPRVRTVENHRANITRKLNLSTTAEIVKYAIIKGYTSLTA